MIKKIIAGFCLLMSTVAFSQENNASPYSYYGIGDVKFKGTVENRSMGGLGIIPDSIHLNLQNPATYSSLKWTTFTLGASNTQTRFKTESESDKAQRTTLDYIAVAIPVKNFGFAFGLMPYTSVGYRIENEVGGSDGFTRFRRFQGNGGLNRVFAGGSYRINSKFSVGADFQYNFGQVETKSITGIPQAGIQYPTREINSSDFSGASFNIGAVYQTRINGKYEWVTSATYTPQSTLKSSTERETATITITSSNREIVMDQIDQSISEEELKMPSKFTFGSGFGEARKWFVGAEYTFQESNELGNRFDAVTDAGFETAHKFSLGGYYIPKYFSFNSYLSRVTYRAGLRYEKTGLVVNGESINDMGLSLGFGLPLLGGSNLNIGAEYGQRGTTTADLVKENYFNIMVSLSISDRWFVKRKYD
ncbi:outer membrane protein transport protein [Flavobacterium sp.]|uniref:outer membrane protein transport protein n=1 Tax=Flavobacterium sp. TaxID=239 RepID=UPI00403394F7